MADSAWIEKAKAGDADAFSRLVEKYQSMVHAVALAQVREFDAAEDIAQEAFVIAWQRLADLRDPARFSAWLRTITRNLAKTELRRGAKLPLPLESDDHPEPPGRSPDSIAATREEQEIIWRAVGELPDLYRELVLLYYQEGKSVAEVAQAMQLGEATVRQRLHRARKLLRTDLESVIERGLREARPGRIFTLAVLAALPALPTKAGAATTGSTIASLGVAGGLVGAFVSLLVQGWIFFFGFLAGTLFLIVVQPKFFARTQFRRRLTGSTSLLLSFGIGLGTTNLHDTDALISGASAVVCLLIGIASLLPELFPRSRRARRIGEATAKPFVKNQPYFLWRPFRAETFPRDWPRHMRTLFFWSFAFAATAAWLYYRSTITHAGHPPWPIIAVPIIMSLSFLIHAIRIYIFGSRCGVENRPR